MKYDEQTIKDIIDMKQNGVGSRLIAELFGISKSGVNEAYNRFMLEQMKSLEQSKDYLHEEQAFNKHPAVLFIDLETAPDIAAVFGRRKQNIGQDAVIQEGGWIISAAWKWLGDKQVRSQVLSSSEAKNQDDYTLCWVIYELLNKADAVVAHNGQRFDLPLIRARLAKHDFGPHKKVKVIDTLRIARQMRFQSNKLDSLGVTLGCGRKQKHSGISLWIDCMNGDQNALNTMQEYNKQDIVLLEQVYHKLKAFDNHAPNLGLFYEDNLNRCFVCGSENLEETGHIVSTAMQKYEEVSCLDCGARSRKK